MAKQINNNTIELCVYYDAESATNKVSAKTVVVDGDLSKRKQFNLTLTAAQQAEVDALLADAMAQVKADEGIV